ncbi:hypothetical protein V7190_10455 [Bacillus velezensis]|uniref:hypothetical protein n=1 Tax=Bacillus velezensis TaxID=492670 RepID=UPI002FFFC84C
MNDKDKAIENVMKFLEDETKKVLLVRGYDNDAKVRVVLYCLNEIFIRGIIRTSKTMSGVARLINNAFEGELLPNSIKSTTTYNLGRMTVKINGYEGRTKSNPNGNESTFTLYYPVQRALDDSKRYVNLLKEIEKTHSRKIILITTNEWSIKSWDIENHVDEVFFYNVENDNPQLMSNLKANGVIE